jgi:NAD(P)-dependent dehydrogenase (short-subunit alcohol dehydrogenase family)
VSAIVTGAASGVGAATAQALGERGIAVAVCDIDTAGEHVADACGGVFYPLDVTDPAGWERLISAVEPRLGAVEHVHLNAGVMTTRPDETIEAGMDLGQIPLERIDRVLDVNVKGVVLGLRALWPVLTGRGRGAVVVTASAAGLTGYPFDPLYAATKHALVGLVRSAAPVLAAKGVRLQALCPGGIDTPLIPEYVRSVGVPLLTAAQVGDAVASLLLEAQEGPLFAIEPDRPVAVPV